MPTGGRREAASRGCKAHGTALGSRFWECRPHPLGRRTTRQNDGLRNPGRSAERILFESRGQFRGLRGATGQAAVGGRGCLRFGGSGSDFAEEPAVRVQSRSRRQ
jgi:hypothetical protein